MTPRYPVLLDLSGQPCLVVGGGAVAERKVQGLLDVGASVTLISPDATEVLSGAAAGGRVSWQRRRWLPEDLTSVRWRFVVAATDDAALNRNVVAGAELEGIWANDVSAPDGGTAALPAVYRDGPVTLTVSTGGVHPGAAGWLRDLAANAIDPEHLTALELVAEVRAASPRGSRPDWRQAIDSGMLDLIREGRVAEAKERLQACLSSSSD